MKETKVDVLWEPEYIWIKGEIHLMNVVYYIFFTLLSGE